MTDLSRKRDRERLAKRREPYWHRLSEGNYLGFRRGPDTWIARHRDRERQQHYHALGENIEFDEAKRRAEAWLGSMTGAAVRSPRRGTVREALETYLAWLKEQGRASTAREVEGRYKTTVWEDDLAGLVLEKLTLDDFRDWRERLREGRQNRSVNRQVRAVVAGLNQAAKLGHVGNPAAWSAEPLVDDVEDDGETAVFLTADQRAALIKAAGGRLGEFLRGLELTGARPKELAAATVGDFTGTAVKLSSRKGRSAKMRVRFTLLSAEGVEFFKRQCRRKLPAAPIFTEDGSQPWRRHTWGRGIQAAIAEHNRKARGKKRLPPKASAYSFRHARISELLQLHSIDPLTVAAQTGTSVAMIEKAYLKFIPAAMREKLEAVQ
jgi:integrase